jgi:hypothetical protein
LNRHLTFVLQRLVEINDQLAGSVDQEEVVEPVDVGLGRFVRALGF